MQAVFVINSPSCHAVRFSFVGRLKPASFDAFARARAAKLDLSIEVSRAIESRFTVEVAGQPDLVDAFEMACSLGPIDCLIMDCERIELGIVSGEGR